MADKKVKHPNPIAAEQLVTVFATEKNTFKNTGAEIHCTPKMAEHLIAKGMASTETKKGKSVEEKEGKK